MINKEIFRWVDDQLETTGIKVDGLILLNLDEEIAIKPSEIRVNEYKTTIGEYFGVDVPGNLSKTKELNKFNETILTGILNRVYDYYTEIYFPNKSNEFFFRRYTRLVTSIIDQVFSYDFYGDFYKESPEPISRHLVHYAEALLDMISSKLEYVLVNSNLIPDPLPNTENICWIENIDLDINLNRAYLLIYYIGEKNIRPYEFIRNLTHNYAYEE